MNIRHNSNGVIIKTENRSEKFKIKQRNKTLDSLK
jgi:hypothetical protein